MALKDKTVTLQSADLCSTLLARPDTQRERYKNMKKQKDTASRLHSAYKIKQQTGPIVNLVSLAKSVVCW